MNNKKPDSGYAYPVTFPAEQAGMSLRDHFAGLAMQSLINNNPHWTIEDIAKFAYRLADAMIAERAKNYE